MCIKFVNAVLISYVILSYLNCDVFQTYMEELVSEGSHLEMGNK